jgi:uncharacterized protein DUF3617
MTTSSRCVGSVLLSIALTAVLGAQKPALNVNMGLWEITTISNVGGQAPAFDTSKMTPEQKARMEAAMQKMMGEHTTVAKTCMTKEKFDKSNFMNPKDEPGTVCKETITTNTATTLDGNEVCTGEHAKTMQMHMEAQSPTSWNGNSKLSTTSNGRTTTVTAMLTAKWLGADCGDRK